MKFRSGLKTLIIPAAAAALLCSCAEKEEIKSDNENNSTKQGNVIICGSGEKDYEVFDNSEIVEAFRTGEGSSLDSTEKRILEKASEIYESIGGDSLSPIEYEIMIYDYILENCQYDNEAIDVFGTPQENSENPYGVLVENRGICLGYATTFQLFMDMKNIPCLTIYAADDDGEEHGWNQVEIDGKWYYTDITWDDPVPDYEGRKAYHKYFNVTAEEMKNTGHVWDESRCNKADSSDAVYYKISAENVSSVTETCDIIESSVSAYSIEMYFCPQTDILSDFEIVKNNYYGAVDRTYLDGGVYYYRIRIDYY